MARFVNEERCWRSVPGNFALPSEKQKTPVVTKDGKPILNASNILPLFVASCCQINF